MKLLSADTLKYQKESTVQVLNKIFIYKQIGTILEIISSNRIKITGIHIDISSKILMFPYKNVNISAYVLEALYNYDNDYTDITLSYSSSFDINDISGIVCEEYPVSDRLIKDGIDAGEKNIEGNNLFEFDSGNLEVTLDNKDGFLINKNKTGLFDSRNVFWIKYLIKFKKTNEEINWFTGIIDLTELEPDLLNKTVKVLAFGNSYELSRYPAYKLSDEKTKQFPKMGGINIIRYIPSEESQEGIKKISFNPFTKSNLMDSISIDSISKRIPGGSIKLLEYKYPNKFRWDGGYWTDIKSIEYTDADSNSVSGYNGKKTLYGHDNALSWIILTVGDNEKINEFPTEDEEMWVQVKNDNNIIGKKNLGEYGKPILKFDDGDETQVTINFQTFLRFTASTQTYEDVILFYSSANWILQNDNDSIVVVSSSKFWGLIFEKILMPATDMIYEISYSIGGKLFSSPMTIELNGLNDETENFTKSGIISWNVATNWIENNLPDTEGVTDGDTVFYRGYMVKIKRVSSSSGVLIKNVTRPLRLKGIDGDFLEVSVSQENLIASEIQDDVIIKKNSSGEWTTATWYENVSLQYLLDKILTECNFLPSNRLVRNLIYSRTDRAFNIWGKVPKFNFNKNASAFAIDTENEYVYIGIGLDVWRSKFSGSWEKIFSIESDDININKYIIEEMWIKESVLNGNILYIVYTWDEYDGITTYQKLKKILSYEIESNSITYYSNSLTRIIDGKNSYRTGGLLPVSEATAYNRQFGVRVYNFISQRNSTNGENLSIPFRQIISIENKWFDDVHSVYVFPAQGGIDDYTAGTPEWVFYPDDYLEAEDIVSGKYFNAKNGHYMIQSGDDITDPAMVKEFKIKFSFGQSGIRMMDGLNYYIFNEIATDSNSLRWSLVLTNLYNSSKTKVVYPNINNTPYSIIKKSGTEFFQSFTMWRDYADHNDEAEAVNLTYSFSYITKFDLINFYNWDKSFRYASNLTPQWLDITSNLNNNIPISDCFHSINDAVYLGKNNKFRSLQLDSIQSLSEYSLIIEYWNGTSWLQVWDDTIKCIYLGIGINTVSFDIPENWNTCSINGSEHMYFIRIKATAGASQSMTVNTCRCFEEIIWDSEIYNSGLYKRYSPIWMCYDSNKNIIHGCMFNRETYNDDYPFQWCYYVLDLNNDQLYLKRTGDNFEFDSTFLIKDFTKNNNSSDIYCIFENSRFKDKSGFLVKANYDVSTHVISLIKLNSPSDNDYGSAYNLFAHNNDVYGLTKGDTGNKFWEYKKEFSPRIELAKFENGDSLYSVFNYIAQISNSVLNVTSDRKIIFQKRGTNDLVNNLIDLKWDENLNISQPKIGYWKHLYDSVVVEYNNLFIDYFSGQRKKGDDGWLKNVLSINNPLIQNNHLAKLLAEDLYDFFSRLRLEPENFLINFMPQLECLDDFYLILPSKIVDANNSTKFILTSIKYNQDMTFEIKGLEKI
jgi:hypothetical protein